VQPITGLTPAVISANGTRSPAWKIASNAGLEQVTATYGKRSDGGISVSTGVTIRKNKLE
jgi:lipocalin